jgi:hypothetical protein
MMALGIVLLLGSTSWEFNLLSTNTLFNLTSYWIV